MSAETIAICRDVPLGETFLAALAVAPRQLRVRHGAGLIELIEGDRDAEARLVLQVHGPRLVQAPGEAARLLGARVAVPEPGWWVELHGDAGVAEPVAAELATLTGGVWWHST